MALIPARGGSEERRWDMVIGEFGVFGEVRRKMRGMERPSRNVVDDKQMTSCHVDTAIQYDLLANNCIVSES